MGREGHGRKGGRNHQSLKISPISASFLQVCVSMYYVPDTILDASSKESAYQCRRHRFDPWVRKLPWRRKQQPTPEFLPAKSQGQRNLVVYSPCGHKKSDTADQLNNNKRYNDEQN